jgi:1-acyl-sn-glycerol-3-phosphate acyltransferase
MPLLRLFLRVFRGCRFRVNHIKKGDNCLILANHVNSTEPVMLEASFNRPVCFLVQNSLLEEPLFRILSRLTPFIGIDKGASDAPAVMKCLRYVREGGILAIYPEGNLTYDGELGYINPGIIRLIRMLRVPVIYYNTKGAYGVDPRFGAGFRRGRMTGAISGRRSPGEIAAMTDPELLSDIKSMLSVDEFSEPCSYKSNKNAEKLERVIYRCPVCGKNGTIWSKGRYIRCSCGLVAEYCDDLTFRSVSGESVPRRVRDWIAEELKWVKSYIPKGGDIIFRDQAVRIEKRNSDLSFGKAEAGELIMTGDHIAAGSQRLGIDAIHSIVLIRKQILMIITCDMEVYRITAKKGFCGLKYIHMFHRLKNLRGAGTALGGADYYGM